MNNFISKELTGKNIDKFVILLFFTLLGVMASNAYDNPSLLLFSYVLEIILIGYTFLYTFKRNSHIILNKYVALSTAILLTNFILSPYNPRMPLLLKFFGYLCSFGYGYSLASENIKPLVSNKWLYSLVILPVLCVFLFDDTDGKNVFFENSNVFVFLGISLSLLFVFMKGENKKYQYIAWSILLLYMIVGTSLGIVVAVALAFIIINYRRLNLLYLILAVVILINIIYFIDLPVFIRFRDVIAVWQSLSRYDIMNIQDIDFYDLGNSVDRSGSRSDTTSSIWRITQWLNILIMYISKPFSIPFGLGADFAFSKTGLPPHNDYLMILTEYGLIFFLMFFKIVYKSYKFIARREVLYLVVVVFCYYITENLINSFPQNVIQYFVIGYCLFGHIKTHTK